MSEVYNAEMEFVQEDVNVEAPTTAEAKKEAKDERVWTLDDGTQVSKSEFIRDRFINHNMSRKEISEQYDIIYRTVYGATINMTNNAEPTTRGRAVSNAKINVTADGQVYTVVDGVACLDGIAVEDGVEVEYTEVDRNEWIREQVAAGAVRKELAKKLGISYGVIYGVTKDTPGATVRHEVEYNGETMSRSQYIRVRFQEGITKAEIARELGVEYPVVWSALKDLKPATEKYAEAIDRFVKTASKLVADEAQLAEVVEMLRALDVKTDDAE